MELIKIKGIISLSILLLLTCSCAGLKKTYIRTSPKDLLKKYRTSNRNDICQAYEIQGVIYFFSRKQNFRGKFYLKGNKWFPWLVEIKSPFGTTLYVLKIEKNLVQILCIREKKLYIINNSKEILMYFGIKVKIPPEFLLKLLTGEWKTFMTTPKKIEQLSDGIKYYFCDNLVKEIKLYYDQNRVFIWHSGGIGIDIFDDSKVLLRDANLGEMVFKIKRKTCVKDKFDLKDFNLKIPSNIIKEVFIKGQIKTNKKRRALCQKKTFAPAP